MSECSAHQCYVTLTSQIPVLGAQQLFRFGQYNAVSDMIIVVSPTCTMETECNTPGMASEASNFIFTNSHAVAYLAKRSQKIIGSITAKQLAHWSSAWCILASYGNALTREPQSRGRVVLSWMLWYRNSPSVPDL